MSNIITSIISYTKNIWHNTDQDIVMAEHINAWENSIENMSNFLSRYAWHPNTAYPKGSVILFPFGLNTKLVSQNAGTSGYVEPTWSDASGAVGNRTINDNGIIWAEKPMEISSDTTPIGTIKQQLWHTAPPGYLKLDTSVVLKRTDYPELWEFVQKYAPLISEVDWQKQAAKQNSVGYYSTGDGTTTFRTPVILDFARGGSISNIGKYYNDQNKKHSHNVGVNNETNKVSLTGTFIAGNQVGDDWGRTTGVFKRTGTGAGECAHKSDTREVIQFDGSHSHKISISETGLNAGGSEVLVKHLIMPYFLRTKAI